MSAKLVEVRVESKSPRVAVVSVSLDVAGKQTHLLLPLSAAHVTVEDGFGKQLVDCWRLCRRQDCVALELNRLVVASAASVHVSFVSEFFVSNANGSLSACLHLPMCSQFSEAASLLRSNIVWDGKAMRAKVEPATNLLVAELVLTNATESSDRYWTMVPLFFALVLIVTLIFAFLL